MKTGGVLAAVVLTAAALLAFAPPDAPVADAAKRGDVEAVRALLKAGADVNAAHGDGMSALHWAAERGDRQLAEMLLYAGARVDGVTRIGQYTPLHVASRSGSASVVSVLLASGADPGVRTTNSGVTPLHLAAAAGSADAVQALIDAGADVNARETEWEQTPLTFAAAANRVEVIQALLANGADPGVTSKVVDLVRRGELGRAARTREREVIESLAPDGRASADATQVQTAIVAGRAILESGEIPGEDEEQEEEDEDDEPPPTITTKGGLTPLLHAARQGHHEAAFALIDGGADIDQVGAGEGTSPLLMATINGHFDLAMALLERGADPNLASGLNGATPLWAAINTEWQPRTRYPQPQEGGQQQTGYLELMEALLEAGADPDARMTRHPWYMVYTGCGNRNCGLVDTNGATPFWRAAYATDVAAMRLLMEYGADPNIPTRAPHRRARMTPDEFLRRQNRQRLDDEVFAELSDSAQVVALTSVREELNDSVKALYPDSLLASASDSLRPVIVAEAERADSIRETEPDPSGLPKVEVGGPGVFPIHAASGVGYGEGFAGNAHRHVQGGWMPAVRYLVEELGADVDARDFAGYSALHNAASRGDDELILYLVEKGADVTVVSRRGQTTADMANGPVQRVSPFPETVALLEKLGSKNNHNCLSC